MTAGKDTDAVVLCGLGSEEPNAAKEPLKFIVIQYDGSVPAGTIQKNIIVLDPNNLFPKHKVVRFGLNSDGSPNVFSSDTEGEMGRSLIMNRLDKPDHYFAALFEDARVAGGKGHVLLDGKCSRLETPRGARSMMDYLRNNAEVLGKKVDQ